MVSSIDISTNDLKEFRDEIQKMERAVGRKKVNASIMRNLGPMLKDMKQNSPSVAIAKMTAKTTRQTKRPTAPPIGARIGVINNDKNFTINGRQPFFDFSAPGMASVLEYGTKERWRRSAKSFGISIGVQSTGSITGKPWIRPAYDRNEKQFIAKTLKTFERIAD